MSDSRMFSLPIVIRFDVLKDSMFGDASSQVSFSVNQFDFQRVKKALHRSIVITVGSASHAAAQIYIVIGTLAYKIESLSRIHPYLSPQKRTYRQTESSALLSLIWMSTCDGLLSYAENVAYLHTPQTQCD